MTTIKSILLSFFSILFVNLSGQNVKPVEPESEAPIICKVGVYVKTIRINQADETFEVLFYWWLRVDSIKNKSADFSMVDKIEFINSDAEITIDGRDSADNHYYVYGKSKTTIPYKADYRSFPFDRQSLVISMENNLYNKGLITYVPDNLSNHMNVLSDNNVDILNGDQYIIKDMNANSTEYTYKTNFGDPSVKGNDTYSRIEFKIGVERNPMGMIQKIALPLFVVLILAYLVFYIPDHEIGTASGLTVTALLAAIAFQWTLNDSLPKASYLTLIDKIFYLVYFFIFYAMAQTVVTYNLSQGGDKQKMLSAKWERHSRYLFPIAFIVLMILILW